MRAATLVILFVTMSTAGFSQAASTRRDTAPDAVFWSELRKLCGKAYSGSVIAAPEDDTTFRDRTLIMHVRACDANRVRIPFHVGEDRSRTWILSKSPGRLTLKHDHRHQDGKPDKVTMYGGTSTNPGLPTRQTFPADAQTFKVVPAAAPNVWWIDLVPGEHFTYNLRRMGSERYFSIRFDLKREVEAPPAPWGWRR
jgi:hypothetical protein